MKLIILQEYKPIEFDYGFGTQGFGTYIRLTKNGVELAFIPDPDSMSRREKSIHKGKIEK